MDLSNLTLTQAALVLVIVTALDVGAAYVLSITQGKFDLGAVAIWVQSHTIKRVFPIFALAVLGHGIPQLGLDPVGPFWGMALVALAAYALETIASIRASFGDASPPADTQPAPTPPA